jgi:RNA polymerase sigma factor (sigma-70 family)
LKSNTGYIKLNEDKLVEQLRIGDENALKQVYRSYFKQVQHFVISNNGSEDDARDIYQDAICVLYEMMRKPSFELSCSVGTYIYSVSRNLWLKELRKKSNGDLRLKDEDDHAEVNTEEETELFLLKEGRIDKINESMKELGEPCNTILSDFFYHKLSMEEISEKMGYTNAENAKNQKYKCFIRLKKIFMANSNK